jgi:hypothetical protein
MRILPSDGNDALAHDARRIRFGDLSEATTMRCFAGDQLLNAHVHFLFVDFQDECASIRTKNLMRRKEFNCISRFVFPAKAVWRTQAQHRAMLIAWLEREIIDGMDERICGRQQQHERRGVGSEAGVRFAWMLICTCIFCIGP